MFTNKQEDGVQGTKWAQEIYLKYSNQSVRHHNMAKSFCTYKHSQPVMLVAYSAKKPPWW
jgi:hypothetical protein